MTDQGHRIRLLITSVLTVIGAVTTYFSSFGIFEWLWKQDATLLGRISLAYFFVFLLVMFLVWAHRIYQSAKKERYANVTDEIHQVNHYVRNFISKYDDEARHEGRTADEYERTLNTMRSDFTLILDRISNLFSTITGTRCRAAIKTFYHHPNDESIIYLRTLCRDQKSKDNWDTLDRTRTRENLDLLFHNSEFSRMAAPDATYWYFFSNNLMKEPGFHSTSMAAYGPTEYDPTKGQTPYQPTWLERLFQRRKWVLPYRSTVTCAIRHPADDLKYLNPVLRGFLAVDSESRGVFNHDWDVNLVYSFTDALFHPLNLYIKIEGIAGKAGAALLQT